MCKNHKAWVMHDSRQCDYDKSKTYDRTKGAANQHCGAKRKGGREEEPVKKGKYEDMASQIYQAIYNSDHK